MMTRIKLLFCLAVLVLTGCSDEAPQNREQESKPNYGVFKHQMDSLEKARGLEQQMQQDVKVRDQKLRDMGG